MKTAAAKRTPPISIPPLVERVEALALELFTAPQAEAREAVSRWQEVIDAALDARAERLRPPSIPPGSFRQMSWDGRAHGCLCAAAKEALKES
jgi:hypothetical protein